MPKSQQQPSLRSRILGSRLFNFGCFASVILLTLHFDIVTLYMSFGTSYRLYTQVPGFLAMLNALKFAAFAVWLFMACCAHLCFDPCYKTCDSCAHCAGGVDAVNKCRGHWAAVLNYLRFVAYKKDGTAAVPIRFLVAVALILPFNSLWFYNYAASPVLTGDCILYRWAGNGSLLEFEPESRQWTSSLLAPGVGEDAIPAQPECQTLIGTLAEEWGSSDGDHYNELYDLLMHLFGLVIGMFVASFRDIAVEAGGFTEDLLDVYDLYTISFHNVALMKEGKLQFLTSGFNTLILCGVIVAYLLLGLRFFIKSRAGLTDYWKNSIGIALSMAQEVSFFLLRFCAWWDYVVPVSVFMLKNFVCFGLDCLELAELNSEVRRKGGGPPAAGGGAGSEAAAAAAGGAAGGAEAGAGATAGPTEAEADRT